ncbi:MAG: type II CAAX endopeptidase family protein [Bacteroidales bacterium]|nr:type II CAAX endopeptidase family protein [Bacteroidales bacterium]
MNKQNTHYYSQEWVERIVLAILFAGIGSLIMIVFSPWHPLLDRISDYLGRIVLIAFLLIVYRFTLKIPSLNKYHLIFLGLLIMAIAVSLDWLMGVYLIDSLGVDGNTPSGFALLKLNECFVVLMVIILFTKLSGNSLQSIYIQKGNLKLGLIIGLSTFTLAAAGSIFMASSLFKGQNLEFSRILPWVPWILIFVLANATLEETLFRGLFLKKLQPFFGKFISNILIAVVFTVLHLSASYTSDQYLFIIVLFPLALLWGYIIQKTDSLLASILFHAGMDIPIILGTFSNL